MTSAAYRVRRATLEDLGPLMSLWESMKFPKEDLARRITEFQVAEEAGQISGAVGLQILGKHGRIHSEGFRDFSLADELRPLLWERVHAVALNHGLVRVWTSEDAPFWSHCGLVRAEGPVLEQLPGPWRGRGDWLTLKLREDVDAVLNADKEFAVFMAAERTRRERTVQGAKVLKLIASLIAFAILGLVLAGAFYIMQRQRLIGR